MATSFIRYNEFGFWIGDSLMELISNYINLTMEKHTIQDEWLVSLKEKFKNCGLGHYATINLEFDKLLISEERRKILLVFIDETIDYINKKGNVLSVEEINQFLVDKKMQGYWTTPMEASVIINILNHFKKLIKGELKTDASAPMIKW